MTRMMASPIDLLPSAFDAFEIATCAYVDTGEGDKLYERIDHPLEDDTELAGYTISGYVLTIYGHFPTGGVHAITDYELLSPFLWDDGLEYLYRLAGSMNPALPIVDVSVYPWPTVDSTEGREEGPEGDEKTRLRRTGSVLPE